ncbi:MAG: Fe-S-containing hydro-lyase [Oscillospiraceae bacterium]|nr:Fe-S-containing hydro-lyase [Oscillospiraceae bacterium]
MSIRITTPLTQAVAKTLHAGDQVLISGTIYTARDAAHKRLVEALDRGESLPIPIEDAIIYYVGPTPSKPGAVIGSAGPTSSYRMDAYAPRLMALGLRGMLGKGKRALEIIAAMKAHGAVYFGAIGGAAALLSRCITASEVVCYEDLGPEAIRQLTVADFPATVVIDTEGNNLFELGVAEYLASREHT